MSNELTLEEIRKLLDDNPKLVEEFDAAVGKTLTPDDHNQLEAAAKAYALNSEYQRGEAESMKWCPAQPPVEFPKENLTAPRSCEGCGACCSKVAGKEHGLTVYAYGRTQIKQQWDIIDHTKRPTFSDGCFVMAFRKDKDGNCAQLRGTDCKVWTTRPQVCRHYPRGIAQCRWLVARKHGDQREWWDFQSQEDDLYVKMSMQQLLELHIRDDFARFFDREDSMVVWRAECRRLLALSEEERTAYFDRFKYEGGGGNQNAGYLRLAAEDFSRRLTKEGKLTASEVYKGTRQFRGTRISDKDAEARGWSQKNWWRRVSYAKVRDGFPTKMKRNPDMLHARMKHNRKNRRVAMKYLKLLHALGRHTATGSIYL